MSKLGARSKLTPQVQRDICGLLAKGATARAAANCAGVCETSYYLWRQQGEKDIEAGVESPHADFLKATNRARARRQAKDVALLEAALDGEMGLDPKTQTEIARWRLRYMDKGEFAAHATAEVAATGGGTTLDAVAVLLGSLTDVLPEPDGDGDDDE